jgi:dihydroorotate dehydrogenase electron transfer subunit
VSSAPRRGSVFDEAAEVLEQQAFPGRQFILRLRAPKAAARAKPGSFAHLRCGPPVLLRRPLSIMRADAREGWLEFLYKPLGPGLAALAEHRAGDHVECLAPIGNSFALDPARPRVLAIGGGVGIPPMIFLAEMLCADRRFELSVLMGSEVPFPFETCISSLDAGTLPAAATHGLALLEQWGVPSRLASNARLPGAHAGFVTALAEHGLAALGADGLRRTQIVACGPGNMLRATAALARRFDVPCQLALEEYMACGVGGCAGCTVLVQTADGPAMKRVCVDGPVFDARSVYSAL